MEQGSSLSLTPTFDPSGTPPNNLFSQTFPTPSSEVQGPTRSRSALKSRVRLKATASMSTGALKSNLDSPVHSSLTSLSSCGPPKFFWKAKGVNKSTMLFIAHDNPQLGKTLTSMIGSSNAVLAMLESHDGKGNSHFLIGEIVFSGDYHEIEDAELTELRGSGCVVLANLSTSICDVKTLPQRNRGEIIELQFKFPQQTISIEELRRFWRPCTARVDVILDPHQEGREWFPYYEGKRKMAPQFRSKGIGYLRLGDDMSNYGTAFLSLDAGHNYLDEGATNIVQKSTSSLLSPPAPVERQTSDSSASTSKERLGLPKSIRKLIETSRSNSLNSLQSDETSTTVHSHRQIDRMLSSTTPQQSPRPGNKSLLHKQRSLKRGEELEGWEADEKTTSTVNEKLQEHVSKLRSVSKWSERIEILQILAQDLSSMRKLLGGVIARQSNVFVELSALLSETLVKQQNPNVLIAALRCLELFSEATSIPKVCALPWKLVIIELFYLLRSSNKLVQDNASHTLHALHKGHTFTLNGVMDIIDDIITGNRGTNKKKATAGNTHKVLSWLQSSLFYERGRCISRMEVVLETHDIFCLLKSCRSLFIHREESVRESSVGLVSVLLSVEVCQSILITTNTSQRAILFAHIQALCQDLSNPPTDQQISSFCGELLKYFSESSNSILSDLQQGNAKIYDKLCVSLYSAVSAVSDIKEESSHLSPSSSISGSTAKPFESTSSNSLTTLSTTSSSLGTNSTSTVALTPAASVSALKRRISSRCKLKPMTNPNSTGMSTAGKSFGATVDLASSDLLEIVDAVEVNTDIDLLVADTANSPIITTPPRIPDHIHGLWFETKLLLQRYPENETAWEEVFQMAQSASQFFSSFSSMCMKTDVTTGILLRKLLPFNENTNSNDQASSAMNTIKDLDDNDGSIQLAEQAIRIRKLLRVKMADEADFKQAQEALKTLDSHLNSMKETCGELNVSFTRLVDLLNSMK